MYLKSIEIQGFKSFANKIDFKFHNGITAIVGPNGSGKSNVADAVRWVLGEQKVKQLRGGSMQDVIFSGTEIRKPLSSAYVAITLDNSDHQLAIDYDEVTVSRRLYRSGESEYMINGTLCRLKDINELFYDTGIGKEGYSIIGQGQIDRILSGKPEERRELFDEAAGIVKFKRRKFQAQKKLEDQQTNLVRISDILSVLDKQRGPLEKQAEKAKIYLNKKESLKTLDVNVFLIENVSVNDELKENREKLDIAHSEYEDTSKKFDKIKVEYDEIEGKIELLDQEIENGKKSITDNEVLRTKLEGQIGILEEQIKAAEGNEEHLNKRINDISANISEREAEKAVISSRKKEIDDKLSALEAESTKAKELLASVQSDITSLNEEIENNKNTILEGLNNRATIKSKLERLDTMLEQINIQKADVNAKLLKYQSDDMKSNDAIKSLEDAFDSINNEIASMKQKQTDSENGLNSIRTDLQQLDKELQETRMKYQQAKSNVDALTGLAERYEDYGSAVKAVMEQKGKNPGIIGVVADILTADKEYETAIESALGGNIQNIVTEDEACAKKMIAHLKETRAGRATFLPLTSITDPETFKKTDALKEKGVIGLADSLVKINSKYRDVASYLLGRILVVDTVDNATRIAKKYNYSLRMVTLEGEYLTPGGAISGGRFKNNNNFLSRRRRIDELNQIAEKLLAKVKETEAKIEAKKAERNELRSEIENLRNKIQEKFIEQNTARLECQNAKSRQGEAKADFEELSLSKQDLDKQNSEILLQKEEIRNQLSDSEFEEQRAKDAIEELNTKLEKLRVDETEKLAETNRREVETEKVRQSARYEQQNIDRINSEIERFNGELNEVTQGVSATKEETEFRKNSIEELRKTIEASNTALSENSSKLKENQQRKDELSASQKDFFNRREELSNNMMNLSREVTRLESRHETLETSIESKINYMWDEYEITLSDAASLRNPDYNDLPEMKKQIKSLKDEIRQLGDVNVNAIEEYRDISEQYNFKSTQYEDIISAIDTLNGVIDELDIQMREQFTSKFAEINKQFDKVFKEMFGGGHGTLELMEDEDILDAGIKIIAQPPGKKLISMMQMSGGEKSLTAIALLFAIQNLKPSPFCLLDEIEAALDESNVTRFADYLHKLIKNTQFIVITHRRGTMEKADRLYGITMQEKGVSTLVSVNLIDDDLT